MPARHYVVAILLFWGATTGWLFQRDLWPRLRRGEAPPFSIDLASEARGAAGSTWRILRGDEMIGRVHTEVAYREADDTFELKSQIIRLDLGTVGPVKIWVEELPAGNQEQLPGMTSMYRVSRDGELREMSVEATLHLQGTGLAQALRLTARVHLEGHVEGRRFLPSGSVAVGRLKEDLHLEPVEFNSRTSIMNPLHPVNRLTGLRRGQHWRQQLVDPLADSLAALVRKDPALAVLLPRDAGARSLEAEVLPTLEILVREHGLREECLVIEYRSNDLTAHTWVRERDGKVLRQEATLWGERLVLDRL